jgi:uncharacterized membrane protein
VIYVLALFGGVLGALGDLAALTAARDWSNPEHPHLRMLYLMLGALAFGTCAPIFFSMVRVADGRLVEPLMVWSLASAAGSVTLALLFGEKQTGAQWVGFAIVIVGVTVRAVGARVTP